MVLFGAMFDWSALSLANNQAISRQATAPSKVSCPFLWKTDKPHGRDIILAAFSAPGSVSVVRMSTSQVPNLESDRIINVTEGASCNGRFWFRLSHKGQL